MALDDITAVVLAGGNKRFSFKEFYRQLGDLIVYREWYFRKGYKSLKRIKRNIDGNKMPRPMIEYILYTLKDLEKISNILVVGPEKEISEKVNPHLLENDKVKIIQQKESFGKNVKEGYAQAQKEYVLLVTSDSPTTTKRDVYEFLKICESLDNRYDIVYPIVKESLLKKYMNLFPRPCFKIIPDTIFPDDYIKIEDLREDGRVGIRITSMTFANLEGVTAEKIDGAYNARKLLRKSSRELIKRELGENIIKKYGAGLKLSELQEAFFDYCGKTVRFVGLNGAGTSLDIDSRRDEKGINGLLL